MKTATPLTKTRTSGPFTITVKAPNEWRKHHEATVSDTLTSIILCRVEEVAGKPMVAVGGFGLTDVATAERLREAVGVAIRLAKQWEREGKACS